MTKGQHEKNILKFLEELNFCYQCGQELTAQHDSFSTCYQCDRSICKDCSRCACDSPESDSVVDIAKTTQRFLDALAT
jgi:hypothetical protein